MNKVKEGNLTDYNNIGNIGKVCNMYFNQIDISGKSYSTRTFGKTFVTIARRCKKDVSVAAELGGNTH